MDNGSVEHQKQVCEKIGYDPKEFDGSEEQEHKFALKAIHALLSGKDKNDKFLSPQDLKLLSFFTGRE